MAKQEVMCVKCYKYYVGGPTTKYCPEEADHTTNGDRIRAMTDEELATVLYNHACMLCPITDCDGRMEVGADACWHRWLDWLKKEVNDG